VNQDDAYRVLLMRAIEVEDRDGSLITEAQRRQLARDAGSVPPAGAGSMLSPGEQDYLARRAHLFLDALGARHPALESALGAAPGRTGAAAVAALAAFVAGAVFQDFGTRNAINILAFPLLAMLLWNLAVYAILALRRLRSSGAGAVLPHGLRARAARWLNPATGLMQYRDADPQGIFARATLRFGADWLRLGAPLFAARGARVLHLAAALLAAGAVAGMYLRGLAFEYRAGWESTFLGADAVARLVGTVLAPAALLSGIDLPQAGEWQDLRLSAQQAGENAARWIHLYALTAGLFIVLPRLSLALGAWIQERRYRADFPLPGRDDRYIARLLALHGGARTLRLLTYSYRLPAPALERLHALLEPGFGAGVRSNAPQLIEYGDEDAYIEACTGDGGPRADAMVLVFSLAATPEHELHGRLCDGLAQIVAGGRVARRLIVLLDESGYRARLSGEAGAALRIEQRRAAWHEALGGHTLVSVDLGSADASAFSVLEDVLDSARAAA
jgi:hypothetical protein